MANSEWSSGGKNLSIKIVQLQTTKKVSSHTPTHTSEELFLMFFHIFRFTRKIKTKLKSIRAWDTHGANKLTLKVQARLDFIFFCCLDGTIRRWIIYGLLFIWLRGKSVFRLTIVSTFISFTSWCEAQQQDARRGELLAEAERIVMGCFTINK